MVLATPCAAGGLLAIGEAPGADEDRLGEGFVGAAGRTLDHAMAQAGFGRGDYGRANICRCRPPENRKPTRQEMQACLQFLASLIMELRPRVLLAVGRTPANVLCGPGSLHELIASGHQRQDWRPILLDAEPCLRDALSQVAHIIPMPHTSALAWNRRNPEGTPWSDIGRQQIRLAIELLRQSRGDPRRQ